MTTAYRRFVRSIEAPISSYEDYQRFSQLDVDALEKLDADELQQAHDLMIEQLASNADARIARVLSGFDSEAAQAALRDAYERYPQDPWDQGETSAEALLGLIRRGRFDDPLEEIRRFLEQTGPKGLARICFELGSRDDDRTWQLLLGLLEHDASEVRLAAAEALLQRLGLAEPAELAGTREWLLLFQLSADTPSVRQAARQTLDRMAEQARTGALEKSAGGSPEPSAALDRFQDSLNTEPGRPPWPKDFDLEALVALKGVERDWMEYALISRLGGGDPRIPRALSVMESTLALEPLRAMLPGATGDLKLELEEAIGELEEFLDD